MPVTGKPMAMMLNPPRQSSCIVGQEPMNWRCVSRLEPRGAPKTEQPSEALHASLHRAKLPGKHLLFLRSFGHISPVATDVVADDSKFVGNLLIATLQVCYGHLPEPSPLSEGLDCLAESLDFGDELSILWGDVVTRCETARVLPQVSRDKTN